MSRPERVLGGALLVVVGAHGVAAWLWPHSLWGLSHLAVWPVWLGAGFLVAGFVALLAVRWLPQRLPARFPGRRGALLASLLAGLLFGVLHERQHLYGDGSLLIRSRGMSTTFLRGPVLVRVTASLVRASEDHLGIRIETSLVALSVLAGMLAVYLVFRLCSALAPNSGARWLLFATLASTGAWQLFFGHVEYYALLAVPILAYLLHALHAVQGQAARWGTWISFAVLPTLHLSALGLVPAQMWLGVQGFRGGERWRTLVGVAAAALILWGLPLLAQSGAERLALQAVGGVRGYIAPYFDATSSRHAFGLFSAGHLMALLNDALLLVPLAFVAIVVAAAFRRQAKSPPAPAAALPFLSLAAAGCLLMNVLFNREIGPYRDWDTLAPYAFVTLTWAGFLLISRLPQTQRVAAMLGVVAFVHLAPWTALNASAGAAEGHVRTALQNPSLWSPYARGYMHEEFAILARDRGDLQAALREYRDASAASPGDARYRLGIADTSFRLGDFRNAEAEYREALARRPTFLAAHNNLAGLLMARGELTEARIHAREGVRLDPSSVEALLTLGDVEARLGDLDAAWAAWTQALRLRPGAAEIAERLRRLQEFRRSQDRAPSQPEP